MNVHYKSHIDRLTGDTVLKFYDMDKSSEIIGETRIEFIKDERYWTGRMTDELDNFDPDEFDGLEIKNGAYVEYLVIYNEYRGKGYFKHVMDCLIDFLRINIGQESCAILRASSENENIPNEKLVQLYERYGFYVLYDAGKDGVFMVFEY